MTTEESIVYQLLNTIRAAELTNDEVITERRVRSLLRTHRSFVILKTQFEGMTVSDEFFQKIDLSFTGINGSQYTSSLPGLIRLKDNYGIKFLSDKFENIPIVDEEEYYLAEKHLINKHMVRAKIEEKLLTLKIPSTSSEYVFPGSDDAQQSLTTLKNNLDKVTMRVILDNPDDASNYDWTTSEYPCPGELVQVIKENILKKEFSIILQTKADQVPNAKNDTLRYHDQGKVQS